MFYFIYSDEVRDVGERVGGYVGKKHYLHATQLLVTSLARLRNDLKGVEALKDVNTDLHARKEVGLVYWQCLTIAVLYFELTTIMVIQSFLVHTFCIFWILYWFGTQYSIL